MIPITRTRLLKAKRVKKSQILQKTTDIASIITKLSQIIAFCYFSSYTVERISEVLQTLSEQLCIPFLLIWKENFTIKTHFKKIQLKSCSYN